MFGNRLPGSKRLWFIVFGCLLVTLATAQDSSPLSGSSSSSAVLRIQQKVDALYEQKEYERAFFIYKHELAPIGDKYAQYMIGFMYLMGTGVPQDTLMASAWYRLAAERSYPQFVAIRDQLMASFSAEDRSRSDQYYSQLRRKYSDQVILLQAIRDDVALLTARTGSRLPESSTSVLIVDPRSGSSVSSDQYRGRVSKRIEERLKLLQKLMPGADIDTDVNRLDLDALELTVNQEIESLAAKLPD